MTEKNKNNFLEDLKTVLVFLMVITVFGISAFLLGTNFDSLQIKTPDYTINTYDKLPQTEPKTTEEIEKITEEAENNSIPQNNPIIIERKRQDSKEIDLADYGKVTLSNKNYALSNNCFTKDCFTQFKKEFDDNKTTIANLINSNAIDTSIAFYNLDSNNNLVAKLPRESYVNHELILSRDDSLLVNENLHKSIWSYISTLYPDQVKKEIAEVVFYIGNSSLAKTSATNYICDKMVLYVDILDFLDFYYKKDLISINYIYIHESAHLISLSVDEVDHAFCGSTLNELVSRFEKIKNCTTWIVSTGCVKQGTYLFEYLNTYWVNKTDHTSVINKLNTFKINSELNFYEAEIYASNYKKEFVTNYSAVSPLEDIAEILSFDTVTTLNYELGLIKRSDLKNTVVKSKMDFLNSKTNQFVTSKNYYISKINEQLK